MEESSLHIPGLVLDSTNLSTWGEVQLFEQTFSLFLHLLKINGYSICDPYPLFNDKISYQLSQPSSSIKSSS